MFLYTEKYTEAESDIQNNNLLNKIHQKCQNTFEFLGGKSNQSKQIENSNFNFIIYMNPIIHNLYFFDVCKFCHFVNLWFGLIFGLSIFDHLLSIYKCWAPGLRRGGAEDSAQNNERPGAERCDGLAKAFAVKAFVKALCAKTFLRNASRKASRQAQQD